MGWKRQAWRVLVALISLAVLWSATAGLEARAQGTDDLAALRDQVSQLLSQGKSSEAVPVAERYASLARDRYGEDHLEYGAAIAWLAFVYRARARYADVEPLYKRSLAIMEKTLGPDHPNVGISLNNLAELYHSQGRYAEAEPLNQRDLAIQQKALGPDHPPLGGR
jgi:tetratricopeptide (TPR) repeat protein